MTITQVTTFPNSLGLPQTNQITVTGVSGTELKQKLLDALTAQKNAAANGAAAAQSALDAVNT